MKTATKPNKTVINPKLMKKVWLLGLRRKAYGLGSTSIQKLLIDGSITDEVRQESISPQHWTWILQGKVVPDAARPFIAAALASYRPQRKMDEDQSLLRKKHRQAEDIRESIKHTANMIANYARDFPHLVGTLREDVVKFQHQLAEMERFFRGEPPGKGEPLAFLTLIADLDTIVRHFRNGEGLNFSRKDAAFISAVYRVVEPNRTLKENVIWNTIRMVRDMEKTAKTVMSLPPDIRKAFIQKIEEQLQERIRELKG